MAVSRRTVFKAVCLTAWLALLLSLIGPEPFWTDSVGESCHVCGNRRTVRREFRWYRLAATRTTMHTDFPIPAGHVHDWWAFSRSHVSWWYGWGSGWASDNGSTYRDGRRVWTASGPPE